MSGQPLTTNPPYGYMKSPESTKHNIQWVIDEPAAEVVRRIFKLCLEGYGPTQIANQLKADHVMTPTEYWNSVGKKCVRPPTVPFNWNMHVVAGILDRQEYCGDTVNFRTTRKSFKHKKKIDRPQEEWQIFKNTHPAIIDRETFALVREMRSHRRRQTRSGHISMFSGMIYCADCESKLNYCNGSESHNTKPYFCCSSYRKVTSNCTAHYIRETVIYDVVLETMQRVFMNVRIFEDAFIAKQREQFGIEQKRALNAKKRAYDKAMSRAKEIDVLIQRMYEDNVNGKISDERYATLSSALETEQKELKAKLPDMEADLNRQVSQEEGLQRFVSTAKQITHPKELTPNEMEEAFQQAIQQAKTA